jgi:molybdate transport system substrate-binding protein
MRNRLAVLVCVIFAMAYPVRAEVVTVYAAASLRNGLEAVLPIWEARTGHSIRMSLAGTSVLARQIEARAPADVFISANTAWMTYLGEAGHILIVEQVPLVRNRLVLIGRTPANPVDLGVDGALLARIGNQRLAMALVDAVPAGIYGRQALRYLRLWNDIAPQVVQTDNVRAALALVARGATPFGVVYASDAHATADVIVLATFPENSHDPILYPAALTPRGDRPVVRALLDFLVSPEAQMQFVAHGFLRGTP